jgi:hypothetical protein
MNPLQESGASMLRTPNVDTVNEVIKIIKKVRKHIDRDCCKCCKEVLEE